MEEQKNKEQELMKWIWDTVVIFLEHYLIPKINKDFEEYRRSQRLELWNELYRSDQSNEENLNRYEEVSKKMDI